MDDRVASLISEKERRRAFEDFSVKCFLVFLEYINRFLA